METTSRQTVSGFQMLQRYIKELKLTVLLVLTKLTFLTWPICFYFLGKPLFTLRTESLLIFLDQSGRESEESTASSDFDRRRRKRQN